MKSTRDKTTTRTTDRTTHESQEAAAAEREHFLAAPSSSSSSCPTMEMTTSGNDEKTDPILDDPSSPPGSCPHLSKISPCDDNDNNDNGSTNKASSPSCYLSITGKNHSDKGFFLEFMTAQGPPQITLILILLAFSFGSTVGIVPAVMSDRFARLYYGYNEEPLCSTYYYTATNSSIHNNNYENIDSNYINESAAATAAAAAAACHAGYSMAQNALATEMLVAHGLTFFQFPNRSLFG
jgi:hypothetical protein